MKQESRYIELKSGYNDDGPAWIGYVEFSKSGRTTYLMIMHLMEMGMEVAMILKPGRFIG